MPKISLNRLTRREVETSRPGRVADGGGLVLQTSKVGSRSWLFIYRWGGKRPEIGLGAYPSVSLSDAREKARQGREWLAETPKRDPRLAWRQQAQEASPDAATTFGGPVALSFRP